MDIEDLKLLFEEVSMVEEADLDLQLGELTEEERQIMESMGDLLTEDFHRKATKKQLIARRIGKTSVSMAKDREDMLYKKMKFHYSKFVMYRDQLREKYNARSRGTVGSKTKG